MSNMPGKLDKADGSYEPRNHRQQVPCRCKWIKSNLHKGTGSFWSNQSARIEASLLTLLLIAVFILGLSLAIPAEGDSDTRYDESEQLPYENAWCSATQMAEETGPDLLRCRAAKTFPMLFGPSRDGSFFAAFALILSTVFGKNSAYASRPVPLPPRRDGSMKVRKLNFPRDMRTKISPWRLCT